MTDQTSALVPAEDNRLTFGQTHLSADSFIPPRVKVVQQMSKEAADKVADPGDFFNTLTGESYGNLVRFMPISPFLQRVFLVREERRAKIDDALLAAGMSALSSGDGLKCRSYDMYQGSGDPGILCNECPLSKWGPDNSPPLCTETYNVTAMNELGELIILSFSKSSAKVGKRVFSMLRMRQGAPWSSIFEAKTVQERNDKGIFYVPSVTISKDRPAPELLAQARSWAQQIAGVTIDVTPADESTDDLSSDDAPF